jgi:preprotein translocase subunit SecA
MVIDELQRLVATTTGIEDPEEWDLVTLHNAARAILPLPATMTASRWRDRDPTQIEEELIELAEKLYDEKEQSVGPDMMRQLERAVMLRVVDTLWVRHLTDLDVLREGIGLRAYGQQDPLVAFKREAYDMYDQLRGAIQHDIVHAIYHAQFVTVPQPRQVRAVHPGSGDEGARQPVHSEKHPGRNDPCWCGSGKKYKHCHMRQDLAGAPASGPQAEAQPADKKRLEKSKRRRRR